MAKPRIPGPNGEIPCEGNGLQSGPHYNAGDPRPICSGCNKPQDITPDGRFVDHYTGEYMKYT